jgi:hypothetical protein
MSKAAQGFSLRRTDGTPQTAFSQAACANPRRTPLIGREALLGNKRAIYGWKQVSEVSWGNGSIGCLSMGVSIALAQGLICS